VKVLLADDDLDILDVTAYALGREGFVVSLATDGSQALQAWEEAAPDVIVLDARMPKLNGFDVLRTIRERDETPIVMLTARSDEDDIIRGLMLGADDYLTKPFSPRQLAARLHAATRRARVSARQPASEIEAGGMRLDVESHQVQRDDRVVMTTPREFQILHTLMLNAGRIVPTSRLIERVWGFDGGDAHMLKTHISNLRKKLGLVSGEPGFIRGVPSVDYILETGERPEAATSASRSAVGSGSGDEAASVGGGRGPTVEESRARSRPALDVPRG
jgi:DNA-binding response OmpR family regulator